MLWPPSCKNPDDGIVCWMDYVEQRVRFGSGGTVNRRPAPVTAGLRGMDWSSGTHITVFVLGMPLARFPKRSRLPPIDLKT